MAMLLKNESYLTFTTHMKLYFDNNTMKEVKLHGGVYIIIKYRWNGKRVLQVGRIVGIEPILVNEPKRIFTSVLIIDFAQKFSSARKRVDIRDVLNIRIINNDELATLCPNCIVTDEMFNDNYEFEIPERKVLLNIMGDPVYLNITNADDEDGGLSMLEIFPEGGEY